MTGEQVKQIEQGQAALERCDWQAARESYDRAIGAAPAAEALEGFALAAWWQDDRGVAIDAREQAYRLYRERGDARGAARMALWLSTDYGAFRGEPAISNGWLERARRLLQDQAPCEEHCWALYREALRTLRVDRNTDAALALVADTALLARSLGCTDMEILARSFEGVTLIDHGDMRAGLQRLDEVSAAVVGGELLQRWVIGQACCNLLAGCGRVRDFERAAEWSARLKAWGEQWRHPPLFAACRTIYSEVLVLRGLWDDAQSELDHAIQACERLGMGLKGEALIRLAELRRRQGQAEQALALAMQAEAHPGSILVRAELALAGERPAEALELAERYLRRAHPHNCTEMSAGLDLLVRAAIATAQAEQAAAALARLESVYQLMAPKPGQAAGKFARGLYEAMSGRAEIARQHFEDAADLFDEIGAPYESARARIELAGTLQALDRAEFARQQAGRALEALEALGATAEAGRARTLINAIGGRAPTNGAGPANPPASTPALAGLTRREQQVLRLIAQGKTNAEIAGQLFLSEHTVHRHVANMLTKLNLGSRAAAVALAAAHGLL